MQQVRQAANAWKVLLLLFLANALNFFERSLLAFLVEPSWTAWHLSDLKIGLVGASFTVRSSCLCRRREF